MRALPVVLAAAALALAAQACAQPAPRPPQNAVAFLAQNALAEGVQVLPSGVQYKVLRSGPASGPRPTPEDFVTVNYEGSLLSGEVFDTTAKDGKPATFQLKGLIPGWIEALQLMRPGDQWIIWVPPKLGYGDTQTGPIPPNSVLAFKLELLSVGPQPAG